MTEQETDALYRKVGRRYVPAFSSRHDMYSADMMAVGTFRLVHAADSGARRYEYDVTPATAAVVAALVQFRMAVEKAISEAAIARPQLGTVTPYTAKQLALIEKFRSDMSAVGGLVPSHWQHSSAEDFSEQAAKALRKCMGDQT